MDDVREARHLKRMVAASARTDAATAFLVVDVQNDFMPGGALGVQGGAGVVPVVNALARRFATVVLTQDWHPADHLSFASQHAGRAPFERAALHYGEQVLWPDHCVQGTAGAAFHAGLDASHARLVLRKGVRREVDSYSAFVEADRATPTGLHGWLSEHGVRAVVLAGLATDYCVAWSALDARRLGYAVTVAEDACRAIDLDGSLARAWAEMAAAGVRRVWAAEV